MGINPVKKHVLSNGLVVLAQEDFRAPIVAYHTWYGVGSRHEKIGKTGMAHLFEHLMFKETEPGQMRQHGSIGPIITRNFRPTQ